MRCPRCSTDSAESSRECLKCGFALQQSNQPTQKPVVVCDGELDDGELCTEELKAKQRFCPNCGKKVDQGLFKVSENATSQVQRGVEKNVAIETETSNEVQKKEPLTDKGKDEESNEDDWERVTQMEIKPNRDPSDFKEHYSNRKNSYEGLIAATGTSVPNIDEDQPEKVVSNDKKSRTVDTLVGSFVELTTSEDTGAKIKNDADRDLGKANNVQSHCASTDLAVKHGKHEERNKQERLNAKQIPPQNTSLIAPNTNVSASDRDSTIRSEKQETQELKPSVMFSTERNIKSLACGTTDDANFDKPTKNVDSNKGGGEQLLRADKGHTAISKTETKKRLSDEVKKVGGEVKKVESESMATGAKKRTEESTDSKPVNTKQVVSKIPPSTITSNIRVQREPTILVHFHVIVSEEFSLDSKDKQLVLKSRIFGNWTENIPFLQHSNENDMVLSIDIPRRQITSGSKIQYKYCVISRRDKYEYEYYKSQDHNDNRILTIPKSCTGRDEWHQYDGYVERDPTWTSKIRKALSRNSRIKSSVEIFSSDIWQRMRRELCIQEGLDQIRIMLFCLKRVYFLDNKYFTDWKDFKLERDNSLVATVFRLLEEDLDARSHATEKHLESRLLLSLATLSIAHSVDVDLPMKSSVGSLCESLMIKPTPGSKQCWELQLAEKYFKRKDLLKDAFIWMAKRMVEQSESTSWMNLIPWIHFLSETIKPYQELEADFGHADPIPNWWGTTGPLEQIVNKFKGQFRWKDIDVVGIIDHLEPQFEMDFKLPRTIMTLVDLKMLEMVIQTRKMPVEICIAALVYQFRTKCMNTWIHYDSNEKTVEKCAIALLEWMQEYFYRDSENRARWEMCSEFSSTLLKDGTQARRRVTVIVCAQITLHCLAMYQKETRPGNVENSTTRVLKLSELMTDWLRRVVSQWYSERNLEDNLQVWNDIFAPKYLQSEHIRDAWNKQITDELMRTLGREVGTDNWKTSNLIKLYCEQTEKYHPLMQECLSKIAFKTVSKGYEIDYARMDQNAVRRFGGLLSDMFNTEWTKAVEKSDNVEKAILGHVLQWTPFLHFLKIRNKDQEKLHLFNDQCLKRMGLALSVVDMFVKTLLDGSITIDTLKLISAPENRFDVIAENVMQNKDQTALFFKKAIDTRNKELGAFHVQATHMTILTSLCEHIGNVDRQDVDQILEKQRNIDRHSLNEFCNPAEVDKVADVTTFVPVLNAFKVEAKVIDVLSQIYVSNQSNTFLVMWQKMARKVDTRPLTLEQAVELVWEPVKQKWDKLSGKILSGEITFRKMETKIGRGRDDFEAMTTELQHMNVPRAVINTRLEQLKQFRQLETCVKGANVILKFAKEYGLTGDFDNIETIASHGQQDFQMKSFDEKLMDTCKALGDLQREDAYCLEAFVKSSPLVNWLKESMQATGLKELKVFVDLAFISAGDEPINQKRVECLNSAVTDYAPLIFDLKTTANYTELLEKCKLVWGKLKANPNLPKQLIDTNRQLQWLKDIKKAHGSVEVTSLNQVDTINACGIYTIGQGAWKGSNKEKTEDLMSVLQLTISEEVEGQTEIKSRNYKFNQLQDLQSRLMLVAGQAEKGNEGVETFTSVFDSIVRLSNVYLQLCSAGCVLFNAWTARFLCDVKRPVCVELEFGYCENTPYLKGRRSEDEGLKDMVRRLANFMEECYESWLQHIQSKRREYQHLNFYTVDQLVILQRELVKFGTGEDPTDLIYPILSAVKPDCTQGDLLNAIEEAKAVLERPENEQDIEPMDDSADEDNEDDSLRKQFIEELVNAGYSEEVAEQAIEHVENFDVDAGIMWCMDRIEEAETSESECGPDKQSDASAGTVFFGLNSNTQASIQNLLESNIRNITKNQSGDGFEPLRKALVALWEEFLGSVSSSVRDYLSLEHLGLILQCLAKQNQFCVNRNLPSDYQEGVPNLLVCPTGDVLPTVLTIYMTTKDQPLPQQDEVLVCTPKTTIDEVDIFWKRGLFGDTRKIHCLVNVDQLGYNVSDAAERNLEEYLQSGAAERSFKLVVVSGSDNANRSRIVSALDKFHRPAPFVNKKGVQAYLADKLRVKDQQDDRIKPAAAVDFSNSSVRLIKSWRAGVGKTLYKTRTQEALKKQYPDATAELVSIPLQEKQTDVHRVTERLLQYMPVPGQHPPQIFHIDVAHEVQYGVDYLLFNLLVLGCVTDKKGYMWRRSWAHLYLIETMPLMLQPDLQKAGDMQYAHKMLNMLPDVTCRSPQESQNVYMNSPPEDYHPNDQLFDEGKFRSPEFQRPFQWLMRHDTGKQLDVVDANNVTGDPPTCLQTLLSHCGVNDPSWAELHHFVWFLNTQLQDYETNDFVKYCAEDLPGFAKFVLRFLINMSRDFSTRSLNISEQSPGALFERQQQQRDEDHKIRDLEQYQMRRTWERSPHPYLFINYDTSFTFLGFNIDANTGNMIDQSNNQILEKAIMSKPLHESLERNRVPIQENFDDLKREEKIQRLRSVMRRDDKSRELTHDPDETYELTTDNVKKILAIYMRFRCDIPVIIMGETGCGKTRLIKFMCSLQLPPESKATNMILMKVHGGTTNDDIMRTVLEAERVAQKNMDIFGQNVFTVLFFDEANTTEAIGLIKEVLCDKSLQGRKLGLCENLKIVAACNPYRKHSDELIKKLEQAGLGYHVDADATCDRLGRVPMRRLVYRVQPLPQSLLPMVWDFGQLNTTVEDLYIRQMVRRYANKGDLPGHQGGFVEVVSRILTASQDFMRKQKNECSFVSLRDVDRVLGVMSWFYKNSKDNRILFNLMDKFKKTDLDDETRSLVLALGVCYYACLRNRQEYLECVAQSFRAPCPLPGGARTMEKEIISCQDAFLDSVQLEKNIARNMALKENVFMMTVCIELRIPLFLIGKPGSSKSLSKTIVSDAMQGNASREELFKNLKQAQMVSFQCSPLATPDGIVATFRQCAQFQKDKDLDTFVSIVVLDEVGLAEDSPRMPLKTLHPLLEDGCQGDEKPAPFKKVAFIGISNWALDPAKMNRGILVQRDVPDLEEIEKSARGICTTDSNDDVLQRIEPLIKPMAKSYLEIFEKASKARREFYGLRDFYSLVKMVYAFMERSGLDPTWHEIKHAVLRNFGGLEEVDPVNSFKNSLSNIKHLDHQKHPRDPDCSPKGLIEACLFNTIEMKIESRYLLLLTENYGALNILQQEILAHNSKIRPITIFGSSFRSDQTYTQVCRNINKIKVCMETGKTVVLLNLENLYESLYDALNQYYVEFGGERYVDLGLGTHRVKCPVHRKFRLIVVAEKQTVYDKFPIPLINRLEKHFLTIGNMLSQQQHELVNQLKEWAQKFVTQSNGRQVTQSSNIADVFMGYHDDTCSAIVVHVWPNKEQKLDDTSLKKVLRDAQELLLLCATPDAVVRLSTSAISVQDQARMKRIYHDEQAHDSLSQYLHQSLLQTMNAGKGLYAQVTTHSKLLPNNHRQELSQATDIPVCNIMLLDTLSSFDTEQQFSNKIHQFLAQDTAKPRMIVVQCDAGDRCGGLVACARYCVMDEIESVREKLRAPIHVVFIIQLPRLAGGCFTGFQCGMWQSVHIDDLQADITDLPAVYAMEGMSVGTLLEAAIELHREPTSIDDTESGDASNGTDVHGAGALNRETRGWPIGYSTDNLTDESMPSRSTSHEDPNTTPDSPSLTRDRVADSVASPTSSYNQSLDESPHASHRKALDVHSLIRTCVHSALSMVKDRQDIARTTERVPLVLKLFCQDTGSKLVQGVGTFIVSLLKDKESSNFKANKWLSEEAANPDNIQRAGTFRRSCMQTLESKISPILAGVIAYLDTNQNLDILDEARPSWKQSFWLAMLNTPDAYSLKYSDLQSPKRKNDLQEVIVQTTGCDGQMFKEQMPFSWLIYEQIEEVVEKTTMTVDYDDDVTEDLIMADKIDLYTGVLQRSSIGILLARIEGAGEITEAAQAYISDFLHMIYRATADQEHMLVCRSIMCAANHLLEMVSDKNVLNVEKVQNRRLLLHLVCIQLAYKKMEQRLIYFQTMNQVWPECSKEIIAFKEKHSDSDMFKEEDLTFSGLCLLLEDLSPNKKPGQKDDTSTGKKVGKESALSNPEGRSDWLQKVYLYRQVIENVIRLHTENPRKYSKYIQNAVSRARYLWNRVVVVKLFLEHVCASKDKDAITIRHCMPLWTILKEKTNLKEVTSLTSIETFLKSCNMRAVKEFLGKQGKCLHCEIALEGAPIVLPCTHTLCQACLHRMRAAGDNACHFCKAPVPQDWEPESQKGNDKAVQQLEDYQKRCNSFFMDVVSQLCFADNTSPSEGVIDKLLTYVLVAKDAGEHTVMVTKEMSIFDTGIDPNPVFRSFLLQLLMRSSKEAVTRYLEMFLDGVAGRDVGQKDAHMISLGHLIIQCFENLLLEELASEADGEISVGSRCLEAAIYTLDTDQLSVDKLRGVAEARVGLAITAKHMVVAVKQDDMESDTTKLFETARKLCEQLKTQMPWVYLVKYLCRHYGMHVYRSVSKSHQKCLNWVSFETEDSRERKECVDRFVVCGDEYKRVREALTRVLMGEDVSHLEAVMQDSKGNVDVLFNLAVHREITCSNLHPAEHRNVTTTVLQTISDFVKTYRFITKKKLTDTLIHNQLGHNMCVQPDQTLLQQGIQCLTVHFMAVLDQMPEQGTLIQPLNRLLKTPQHCKNAYLPTMPEDYTEEIMRIITEARENGDNAVFYMCPKGHPFYFGNCGHPNSGAALCQCGEKIGSVAYDKPVEGVKRYKGTEQNETGHILGPAADRVDSPHPERNLRPLNCTCVRLITHLAMYAGALTDPQILYVLVAVNQGTESLITPKIDAGSGAEYLWQHIVKDLEDIQQYTGRSPDDVILLMHAVVNTITTQGPGDSVRADVGDLSTKEGRDDWEKQFSSKFLSPVLQDIDATLQTCNKQVVEDHRLGADPLLCLLYETEAQQEPVNPGMLQDASSVWRYRIPISLEHLRNMLNETDDQPHKVLRRFLNEDQHLRAIRYIPNIMRLQRILMDKYFLRMDKEEANTTKIRDLKREGFSQTIECLIAEFAQAWDLLRDDLKKHVCRTELGNTGVPNEYCSSKFSDDLPVAILLPSIKGMGICSYAMLDFLMMKQNDFLAAYRRATGTAAPAVVSPRNITTAHLISYDPNRDIMPLVLANCRYSFEMGSGTSIEYDFAGLERQLMDRFLFSKSEINLAGWLDIDMMVYRAEVTNALVFKKLEEKIHQVTLSRAVKSQINDEKHALPDLCSSLDNLDIAISFLSSVGGKPTQNLYDFMTGTLKMEKALISQKARQECQVQHARSLWLYLNLLKSKQIADHRKPRQSMFDNLEEKYHESLPPELIVAFREYMKPMSVDKLSQLVDDLHEYIVLEVPIQEHTADEDYVDKARKELSGWLFGYLEDLDRPTDDLIGFPQEILIAHSSHTWVEAYGMLEEKYGHRN